MTRQCDALDELPRPTLLRVALETMHVGHLVDRALMPQVFLATRDVNTVDQVAIDEWMGASPVYTGRMRRLMKIEGDGAPAIVKALQLDCGFPHQYMDVGLEADRRRARRVLPAALRRADGRRAARRGARDRDVPHDRGSDVRRDRVRDESARARAPAASPTAHAEGSPSALPLDDRDRPRECAGRPREEHARGGGAAARAARERARAGARRGLV